MALFDHQSLWLFIAGILGNMVSILVYFAPLPTFMRICKRKSTLEYDCLPYMVALLSAMLWMYYAFLKKNAILLISINSIGILIETIYVAIFLFYANREARKYTMKILVLLNVVVFTGIYVATSFMFKGHYRLLVVGWICTTFSITVFAAPLSILFQVVRTRSVEFMPLPLSFFLTMSAITWLAYGVLQGDLCIALPNILGFILGLLQMMLYGIYNNKKKKNAEEDVEEAIKMEKKLPADHIVIEVVKIGGGGTGGGVAEVYPDDSQSNSRSSGSSAIGSASASGSDEDENKQGDDEEEAKQPLNYCS